MLCCSPGIAIAVTGVLIKRRLPPLAQKEKLKFELEVDDGLKIKMESHKQAADGTLSRERLQLRCNSVLVLSTLTDAAIGYQVGVRVAPV